MSGVRSPAVAGLFYPDDPQVLQKTLAACLESGAPQQEAPPKALIVPHAGYPYSGAAAGSVYLSCEEQASRISRIVLLGPSHRVAFRGLALPTTSAFQTPLGNLEIDAEAVARIAECANVIYSDQAHAQEHSLEVQLPFIQTIFPNARIVPLVVGDSGAEDVARVIETLWGGEETLVVVSSDLSHFHAAPEAEARDSRTSARILNLETDLKGEDACGCRAINGLLLACKRRGMQGRQLALTHSGVRTGDNSRVVGYGGYAFS
ncbi:AmmeMemoRadiSam system protein B [Marinobacteraceae bacterium S3BR75-40.1]